jgi:hypothetical protein
MKTYSFWDTWEVPFIAIRSCLSYGSILLKIDTALQVLLKLSYADWQQVCETICESRTWPHVTEAFCWINRGENEKTWTSLEVFHIKSHPYLSKRTNLLMALRDHVVRWMSTDVSEEHIVSIFRAKINSSKKPTWKLWLLPVFTLVAIGMPLVSSCTTLYIIIIIIIINGSKVIPLVLGPFCSFLIIYTANRTLWKGAPWDGRYLHTEQHQHRISTHRHTCLEWDSKPRPQYSSGHSSCVRPRGQCDCFKEEVLWYAIHSCWYSVWGCQIHVLCLWQALHLIRLSWSRSKLF